MTKNRFRWKGALCRAYELLCLIAQKQPLRPLSPGFRVITYL
jgi:hypothetical protein